jgi:uncharacterized Zn finger protein
MTPWDWDHGFFPPSRPREARGGIRAQSKRGGFGQSWWSSRWIETLEGFGFSARLQRGRSYARRGQVLSIDIGSGAVRASVQGSRPKPYAVTIRLRPIKTSEWKRLATRITLRWRPRPAMATGSVCQR